MFVKKILLSPLNPKFLHGSVINSEDETYILRAMLRNQVINAY